MPAPIPYPRVAPATDGTQSQGWLRDVVWGQQVPQLISTGARSSTWDTMTLQKLADKLGRSTRANLIVSPTGVVGYYNTGLVQVSTRDGRVWGRSAVSRLQPQEEDIELPHVQVNGNLGGYADFFRDRAQGECFIAPREHVYLRTCDDVLPHISDVVAHGIPMEEKTLQTVSVYWSQRDTVTNLHWDLPSGCIQQLRGRKQVVLFPPSEIANLPMYPLDHIFARRSIINGRMDAETFEAFDVLKRARGMVCDLGPGDWIYIPGGWLHHVTTCDDDCISLIITFRR